MEKCVRFSVFFFFFFFFLQQVLFTAGTSESLNSALSELDEYGVRMWETTVDMLGERKQLLHFPHLGILFYSTGRFLLLFRSRFNPSRVLLVLPPF
jgi:hypothetical protein